MSLYQAHNRHMDRGFVPYRRQSPIYKTLAEEAAEFERQKTAGTAQTAYILERISRIEGAITRMEAEIARTRIDMAMPSEVKNPRIVSPEEQIQMYFHSITNEEDRKVLISKERDAQTVKYRKEIIEKLIAFGATISTISRMLCRDHGTIIHLTKSKSKEVEEKRQKEEKPTEKCINHRITRAIRRMK